MMNVRFLQFFLDLCGTTRTLRRSDAELRQRGSQLVTRFSVVVRRFHLLLLQLFQLVDEVRFEFPALCRVDHADGAKQHLRHRGHCQGNDVVVPIGAGHVLGETRIKGELQAVQVPH